MPGTQFESSQPHHAVVCYRRFPEGVRKAPNWRGSVRRFVLRDGIVTVGTSFLRIFLWPRNPVSRKRRPREAETRFECRLRRRKSEHLVAWRRRFCPGCARVTSRSNWANDSSTFSVSRPIEVVVLNCWVTDTKDTWWRSNSSTSFAKSASDRVRRSTL